MNIEVRLTRVSDGEQVTFTEKCNSLEGAEFRWKEGNESCDCVRSSYFDDEDWTEGCTDDAFTCEVKFERMEDFMPIDKVYDWLNP